MKLESDFDSFGRSPISVVESKYCFGMWNQGEKVPEILGQGYVFDYPFCGGCWDGALYWNLRQMAQVY